MKAGYSLRKRQIELAEKVGWKPKDLRNCLPTFAVMAGRQSDFWEQYSGRAPRTVYACHYVPKLTTVSMGEHESLSRQMAFFRFHVVDHLNKAIAGEGGAQILNFFEPGREQPADEFKAG